MQCVISHNFGLRHCPISRSNLWFGVTPKQFIRGSIVVAALGLLTNAGAAVPPAANFDLSRWKITLPIDDFGGTTGEATEIKNPSLQTYTSEFFYTGTDGAMVFWCPVIGATTSGATAPRSELRELISGTDSRVNWSAMGTHILRAQCRVTQEPDTGDVIIGQVHGYPSQRLVKVQYGDGRVQVYIRNSLTVSGDTKFIHNVGANPLITNEIKVVDGVAFVTVNGVMNSHNFGVSDPAWLTDSTFYFKAGAYLQDNSGPLTEGGRVSFYQLSATHGTNTPPVTRPSVTTQPLSRTVALNANVTLSVTAAGSPLNYQWRANGVNLAGRTNAALTITNFRSTDQKNYDVVVSNSAGSVTSAPAALYLNSPLRFLDSRRVGGNFSATLLGVAGSNYVIETSTNLVTWAPISTNSSATGIVPLNLTTVSGPRRFYRAR
jgi:hypothetical protein